jgi:protein-disulfide isomerase
MSGRTHRLTLAAALSVSLAAASTRPARAVPQGGRELSEDDARRILPRADLSGLSGEQRASFLEVAGDVFDYAGCRDTLARCLSADEKDVHAVRMSGLVKALLVEGYPPARVIDMVESYYASFDASKRIRLRENDCPLLGDKSAPVIIVEFSDYQCPHCAVAARPLHDLVTDSAKGKARLCSKYFPLPMHPRAAIAAACAEYARRHGKFWELSELLFAHQDALEDEDLKALARQVGLDGAQMLKEAYSGKFDAIIEANKQEGIAAGVDSTPTLFFNGRKYNLPVKPEFLLRSVEDELEWQQNKAFVYDRREAKAEKKG